MAITPTVLTATAGFIVGDGIDINAELKDHINALKTIGVSAAVEKVKALGYDSVVAALPQGIYKAYETAQTVETHVRAIFPEGKGGLQQFITTFGGASAFVTASAEFAAALNEFKDKAFTDIGVNFESYRDILTNGASSITQGLQTLADTAKEQASELVSEITAGISETAGEIVDSVTREARSLLDSADGLFETNAISSGLKSLGTGLKNFGDLIDFENLENLGPQNLIEQLQKQGLTVTNGIDDMITGLGYSLDEISSIPETQLQIVLENVSGVDLEKIIKTTGATLLNEIKTAADLLKLENIIPKEALIALNILDQAPDAIRTLGDTIANLGVRIDNFSIGNFLENIETTALKYLDKARELISSEVISRLQPIIGMGQGLFENPDMKDMMASVAGIGQNGFLDTIQHLTESINDSTEGSNLIQAVNDLETAINALANGDPLDPAYSSLSTAVASAEAALSDAVTGVNDLVSGHSVLSGIADAAAGAVSSALAQVAHEAQMLIKAGLKIVDGVMNTLSATGEVFKQVASGSYALILSFADKLHNYGVDKVKAGFNDIISQLGQDNIYGDALKASLIEGRNLVRSQLISKSEAAVADQSKEIREKLQKELDELNDRQWEIAQMGMFAEGEDKLVFMDRYVEGEAKVKDLQTRLGMKQ